MLDAFYQRTTMTIVSRAGTVGLPDDRRNRAWLHDGNRWRRPSALKLELSAEPYETPKGFQLDRTKAELTVTTAEAVIELVGAGPFTLERKPDTLVIRGEFRVTNMLTLIGLGG